MSLVFISITDVPFEDQQQPPFGSDHISASVVHVEQIIQMGEILEMNIILICSKLLICGYGVWSEWWDTYGRSHFNISSRNVWYSSDGMLCTLITFFCSLSGVFSVPRTKKAYQMRLRVWVNSDFSIVLCKQGYTYVYRWQTYIILAMVNSSYFSFTHFYCEEDIFNHITWRRKKHIFTE